MTSSNGQINHTFFFPQAWSLFCKALGCMPVQFLLALAVSRGQALCTNLPVQGWQPGWLQNVCVEEPRALLGRLLIAGWQRAGELGWGWGCSVLAKSRFGELIRSSNEPSPRLLCLQHSLGCCWDVWCLVLGRKACKPFPWKRANAVLGQWQWGENRRNLWECSANPRLCSRHTARRKHAQC